MKTAVPWRVRATIWTLTGLFLLALVGGMGLLIWSMRNNALEVGQAQINRFIAGAEAGLNRTFLSVDVLLVHAQDHLMCSMLAQELVQELICLYECTATKNA